MSLNSQVREIEKLKGSALREKFREVTGLETRSNNKPFLIKRIVAELYKREHGTKSSTATAKGDTASARATKTDSDAKSQPNAKVDSNTKNTSAKSSRTSSRKERDPRLPEVGKFVEKEHEGKTIKVEVLDDGFRYKGKEYRSLSAIAKEITGTIWNGFLWFGLVPSTPKKKRASEAAAAESGT